MFLNLSFTNGVINRIICNRPFAAKPSPYLLFIKLWAATLRMPEMEKACQKITIKMAKFEAPGIIKRISFYVDLNF